MPLEALYTPQGQINVTALWQRAYLGDRLLANDLEGIQALADATGGGQDYAFEFGGNSWPPSYCTFRQGSRYEITVQGTSNTSQLLLHLGGVILSDRVPQEGFVNSGWNLIALGGQNAFRGYLADKPAPSLIVLSGHSYGAGVAAILANRLAEAYPDATVQLVTYGSPRWGSGGGFAVLPQAEVRVVNEFDVIPRLPPQLAAISRIGPLAQIVVQSSAPIAWLHRGQRVGVNGSGSLTIGAPGEEEPNAIPSFQLVEVGPPHLIGEYRRRLTLAPGVVFPAGWVDGAPGPQPPSAGTQLPVSLATQLAQAGITQANRLYYGTPNGPITVGNQSQWQSGGLSAGTPKVRFSADIQEGRNTVAAASPWTKCTFVINNGINGHLESHVVAIPVEQKVAVGTAVGALGQLRQKCLGNGQTGNAPVKSPRTPQIEYVRCTDAVNPRNGFLIDWSGAGFFGDASTGGDPPSNSAEAMFKAVTLRLTGLSTVNPATLRNTTCQLVGFPDEAMSGYNIRWNYQQGAGPLFGNSVAEYWNWLAGFKADGVTANGQPRWGFFGASPRINAIPPTLAMTIVSFVPTVAPAAPNWIVTTAAANDIANGDRVRIRGSNGVFNGVWQVEPYGGLGTQFVFKKPPVSGHTAPNGGFVYRLQSGGVSLQVFYQYQPRPQAFPQDSQGSVVARGAKHDAGRQWLPYSFLRRVRRER